MRKEIHLSWQTESIYNERVDNLIIKYIKKHPFRLFPKHIVVVSPLHNYTMPMVCINSSLTTKYIIDRDEPEN